MAIAPTAATSEGAFNRRRDWISFRSSLPSPTRFVGVRARHLASWTRQLHRV